MPAPNYYILDIDTSVARNGQQLLPPGDRYDGVTVISFPAGLVASLAFGSTSLNKFIPILFAFQTISFDDVCSNPFQVDEGLSITNNVVIGTLRLLISVGGNQPTT